MARKARNPGVGVGHGERIKKPRTCIDCGGEFLAVRSDALRCSSCGLIHVRQKSAKHESWRKSPCPDCGQLKSRNAVRCVPCEAKRRVRDGSVRGERGPNWKGGKTRAQGYIFIRNLGDGRHYVPEHRWVWEQANGPIPDKWVVHHLNGLKDDNRLENLVAMARSHHGPRAHIDPSEYEKRIRFLEAQLASR